MKDFLIESLKYQYSIGVKDIFDFLPNRSFSFEDCKKNDKENLNKVKQIFVNDSKEVKDKIVEVEANNLNEVKELLIKERSRELFELKRFAKQIVFGDGNENSKILIIGEAPGEEEDESGVPFCGRSGQLLMSAFKSISLERENDFYVTNTVFWRPLDNRKPKDVEISSCKPYLDKIIDILKPKIVILVGNIATSCILRKSQESFSQLIGNFYDVTISENNIKVFPIYHPSYLLRSPSSKKILWKNLLLLKKYLIEICKYDI